MPTHYSLPLMLLFTLCIASPARAQHDTLQFNPREICIDINYMMPQRYTSRAVNDFSLCLKGDTVESNLPYIGQAYRPSIDGNNGLNFKLPIMDKSVAPGKKNRTIIKFSCKNSTTTYDFKIEVYPEGAAYITLTPSNADRITYKGVWETLTEHP